MLLWQPQSPPETFSISISLLFCLPLENLGNGWTYLKLCYVKLVHSDTASETQTKSDTQHQKHKQIVLLDVSVPGVDFCSPGHCSQTSKIRQRGVTGHRHWELDQNIS